MKTKFLFLFSSWIFLFSCNNLAQNEGVTITGQIKNLTEGEVFIEKYITSAPTEIAKTKIEKDGEFSFKLKLDQIGFYRIGFNSPEHSTIESHYINLVVDTLSKIKIKATAPDIEKTLVISGSDDSEILKIINTKLKSAFERQDLFTKNYQQARAVKGINQDSLSAAFKGPYEMLQNERDEFIRDLVLEKSSSIALLSAINFLDKDKDLDSYQLVDKSLMAKYPEHPYVKDFHRKVLEMSRLSAGSVAPEIMLNDPKGKEIKLSSLNGKVVLVHFGASWSSPSRLESAVLSRLYKQYKKSGLEIISVGIEKDLPSWIKIIKEDNMDWLNGSDMLFWDSPVAKIYDLKSLPYSYLIGSNGKIVAKGKSIRDVSEKIDLIFSKAK